MSKWYHKSTYRKAYQYPILYVPSTKFMKIDKFAPIKPPPLERMPKRRMKKRIKAFNEPASSGSKLSKKGQLQECSCCKSSGHNKVRCSNKDPNKFQNYNHNNQA
ncbi:hypothetical protein C2S51_022155 [Perilla frutescens var. frutescens]|nr:hypothetical protein C2S51_022155 [Perilla frutescens var. frutescens]